MQVRVTGTTRTGEPIDFETTVPEELAVGDSFILGRAGQQERVVISGVRRCLIPEGVSQTIWTVEPHAETKAPYNRSPRAEEFDRAEERLRDTADEELAALGVVRQATEALSWALAQSDMPPAPEGEPLPAAHAVGTALLFLGVMAHRAVRAAMALIAVGYEPEALGLKRLLTEIHARVKTIIEDSSGQHAREWLEGRPPSTPRKLVAKHGDSEVWKLYSESAHADAAAVKSWLLQRGADREWGIIGSPERRPEFANLVIVELAYEVRDIAVALATIRGLQPPALAALNRALNDAEARYLAPEDGE